MNLSTITTPKTLSCPHCGTQMNLTGPGRAVGSVVYFCRRCVPLLRLKELWRGQVVRTGSWGFGFVQLQCPVGLDALRFKLADCYNAHGQSLANVQVGDQVLVLLGEDTLWVKALWKLSSRPSAFRSDGVEELHRRRGVVTCLKAPDWGFLVDQHTGKPYFVHQNDILGGHTLAVGQKVTFLPGSTPKGSKACEVRIVAN